MSTAHFGAQPPVPYDFDSAPRNDRDDQIVIHLNGHFDGTIALPKTTQDREVWNDEAQAPTRRATSKRSSRSFTSRVSRQKSRRRELLGRQAKLDTSFARHKGDTPHQVFPENDGYGYGNSRKSWFSVGRASTKFKGLGITKGTPQPGGSHRRIPSIEHEPKTADSLALAPGTATWNEISPWDRPIPIGITVPTDSISDFSPYQGNRQRSGSDTTLVTPSIVITPAMPMQSVWSPDTPYTESDYTPSIYSRYTLGGHSMDHNVPPVPALPLGLASSSAMVANVKSAPDSPTHNRNDTLDSNETAFEEDDADAQRKNRVMSSDTFFEEDDIPLRGRTVETSLVVDTSLVPTPRRSQGWWNVITTPFVTTPLTGTWPKDDHTPRTPDVPTLPLQYSQSKKELSVVPAEKWEADQRPSLAHRTMPSKEKVPVVVPTPMSEDTASLHASPMTVASEIPADATRGIVAHNEMQQMAATPDHSITSPLSAMSATPVVSTAAMATVLMPRQVEEVQRPINVNIELQDRRLGVDVQLMNASSQPASHQGHTSWPAPRLQGVGSYSSRTNSPSPNLPTFAPPPTYAQKASRFSYDNGSRASSTSSTPDLNREKKHRKVCDMSTLLARSERADRAERNPRRRNNEKKHEKKKKRGCFFWCCGCCLIWVVILAILIPVVVVFTRRKGDTTTTPVTTQPGGGATSQWLTLTNLPPIPTGALTIAQPEAVEEESGCVAPTTLWSCALPKEVQDSVKPNKPDQPNMKIEIMYDNSSATKTTKRAPNAVAVGAFIREHFLKARAAPSPSPAPPSSDDMVFLGKTTDGNSAPFEGEDTPLFVSFQDSQNTASRLAKRASGDPTNITASIPPPMLNSDGTAAPANLLPFPSAQPLRLFNRGQDDEHYGFYSYFDRSIFLKQINGTNRGGNPADTDGGSTEAAATLRCTFAQTRFLVQIWTRSEKSKPLLQSSTTSGSSDLKRPGTFPYPVTVTIDRHGGDATKKNLYCYQMESDGTIKDDASKRSFQFEDRAFGGNLLNGTQGRFNVSGPIDGGSGGCSCKYQNWLD